MSYMFCCLIQYLTLCSSLIKFYADIFFNRSLFEAVADPGERQNVFKYSRTCFNRPFHFKVSRHQRPHYLTIYYYIIFDGEIYFHLKATCLLRLFPRNFKWPHKAGSTVTLPFWNKNRENNSIKCWIQYNFTMRSLALDLDDWKKRTRLYHFKPWSVSVVNGTLTTQDDTNRIDVKNRPCKNLYKNW